MAAKVDQEALTAPGSKAPAHSPAEPQQDRPAPAPARRHHGLIAFAALAVASLEYGLLERGGFWLDDFVNLAEARRLGLNDALLVEPFYQHFAARCWSSPASSTSRPGIACSTGAWLSRAGRATGPLC